MNRVLSAVVVIIVAAAPWAVVVAGKPPADGMPMLRIVRHLEQRGYGPISRISFDDRYWDVRAYNLDTPYKLSVDPHSVKILSERRDDPTPRPPHDAQPLSRTLVKLADEGFPRISAVSFASRHWEVDSPRADGNHQLHVNSKTGEVIRDRKEKREVLVLEE